MRPDGRRPDQLRPLRFTTGVNLYAEGSCIVEMGHTRVLCTATVDTDLPPWRKASGKGWVTAEYRMLPRSTHTRTKREGDRLKGRTSEIERLIGRSLRAAVDFEVLGPMIVTIDCDVLQADGGTRTASINGGYVAMVMALQAMVTAGKLAVLPIKHSIAAVSAGIVEGMPVLDLPYVEDSRAEVDMNVVMTGAGLLVEVQGTAEAEPFPRAQLDEMLALAAHGVSAITEAQRVALDALL